MEERLALGVTESWNLNNKYSLGLPSLGSAFSFASLCWFHFLLLQMYSLPVDVTWMIAFLGVTAYYPGWRRLHVWTLNYKTPESPVHSGSEKWNRVVTLGLDRVTPLPIFPIPLTAKIWENCKLRPHQNYLESENIQVPQRREGMVDWVIEHTCLTESCREGGNA